MQARNLGIHCFCRGRLGGGVIFIIFTDNLYDLEFSSQKGLKLLIFNSHLPIIHLLTACWLVAKNELGETEKRLGRENMQTQDGGCLRIRRQRSGGKFLLSISLAQVNLVYFFRVIR